MVEKKKINSVRNKKPEISVISNGTKKKNLKIIGIALVILGMLVILFIVLVLIGDTAEDTSTPGPTDVLPLEETAGKEGRNIDDFVPAQTNVLPLEQNNKPLVPQPTSVPSLKK